MSDALDAYDSSCMCRMSNNRVKPDMEGARENGEQLFDMTVLLHKNYFPRAMSSVNLSHNRSFVLIVSDD